jgi:hypothetical protein
MLLALLAPLALVAACDKVPLLAPTGTTITIIPTATSVPNNSQMTIVATVIEHLDRRHARAERHRRLFYDDARAH